MLPSNGLPISCRERTARTVKMPMISRAKRSAAWACSAGSPLLLYTILVLNRFLIISVDVLSFILYPTLSTAVLRVTAEILATKIDKGLASDVIKWRGQILPDNRVEKLIKSCKQFPYLLLLLFRITIGHPSVVQYTVQIGANVGWYWCCHRKTLLA